MSKFYLCLPIIFFFFLTFRLEAQKQEIHGKVIDKETLKGVDIATIFIEKLGNYTFTNEDGRFHLVLPSNDLEILTLSIQRLGYKRKSVTISQIGVDTVLIELLPDVRSLPDVTVNGSKREKKLDAKDILRKAIENIPNNYSQSPFLSKGYLVKKSIFRNTRNQNDYLLNVREGILNHFNFGVLQPVEKQQNKLTQLKATPDYRTFLKPFSGIDSLTGFVPTSPYEDLKNMERRYVGVSDLFFTNPIETRGDYQNLDKNIKAVQVDWYGKLNPAFLYNHNFKMSEIIYNNFGQDSIYVVKVLPSGKSKKMLPKGSFKIPLGKIFISSHEFAILRYEYGIYDNPKKGSYIPKAINFSYRIEAEFIPINGKYYLNYLKKEGFDLANYLASTNPQSMKGSGASLGALISNSLGTFDLLVSFEYYASKFETDYEKAKEIFYSMGFDIDFYQDYSQIITDEDFWSNYSYPPESMSDVELRKDLELRIKKKKSHN